MLWAYCGLVQVGFLRLGVSLFNLKIQVVFAAVPPPTPTPPPTATSVALSSIIVEPWLVSQFQEALVAALSSGKCNTDEVTAVDPGDVTSIRPPRRHGLQVHATRCRTPGLTAVQQLLRAVHMAPLHVNLALVVPGHEAPCLPVVAGLANAVVRIWPS